MKETKFDLKFSENKVVKHFVFVGAGASYGARVGTFDEPPPLGKDLASFLRSWLAGNQRKFCKALSQNLDSVQICRIRKFLKKAEKSDRGFEKEMLELWREQNQPKKPPVRDLLEWFKTAPKRRDWAPEKDLLLFIHALIGAAFSDSICGAFRDEKDLYDELIEKLGINHETCIISINYDLLIESALKRAGRGCIHSSYEIGASEGKVLVLKPHGSINFRPHFRLGTGHNLDLARARSSLPLSITREGTYDTKEVIVVDPADISGRYPRPTKNLFGDAPLISAYMPGKPPVVNQGALEEIREFIFKEIERNMSADVLVIGVYIPDEKNDPLVVQILKSLGKLSGRKRFVNPDSNEALKAKKFGFEPIEKGFQSFIDSL